MQSQIEKKAFIIRLAVGIVLLAFGAGHGLTGLLANIGWYESLGIDFDAWYMHPAYQSMCWFANGIAAAILVPMWIRVIGRKRAGGITPVD